jgi:hypothetical protein
MLSLSLSRQKQEKKTELRHFIGIVHYYSNIWFHRSQLLAWLHWLPSHQTRSRLNGNHHINRPLIKSRKSLELRYFSSIQTSISGFPFISILMHQIISWGQSSYRITCPATIAFYSRKLQTAQKRYTTIERGRELLSAIEICKEYKNILLVYHLTHHSLYRP